MVDAIKPVDGCSNWWAMDALLLRANDIGFEFIAAEVITRKPPPPGTKVLHFKTVSFDVNATDSVTFTVRSPSYPSALTTFGYTPVVERIVNRLKQFRAGEESLFTAAYYGLTEISEACTGSGQRRNRPAVASKYHTLISAS